MTNKKATPATDDGAAPAPKFIAVDFFCGAGGTTRGLIDAGGYVIAGIDKDARCSTTYTTNNVNGTIDGAAARFMHYDIFPKNRLYKAGQQEELLKELKVLVPRCRAQAPRAPLLFAICAPCQPFTTLSKKEMSDERTAGRRRDKNLLREAAKFVEHFKPEIVLSENVQGIGDQRYGGVWDAFRKGLEKLGYATGTKVVCTSKFGIPQFRKRSILLAVRKDVVLPERYADLLHESLVVPENDPDSVMVSVEQAIGHLPPLRAGEEHARIPNHRARHLQEINYKRLSGAQPGESNAYMKNLPDGDLTLDCHRKVNAKLKDQCFGDVYTRMHPDRPAPTITTKCHSVSNGRFGHYDTKQVRAITPREAAILQSFPENYIFYPTNQLEPVARMIGNAVPPKLASFYAAYLSRSVKDKEFIRAPRKRHVRPAAVGRDPNWPFPAHTARSR
jgi:DNA (cytosine-5)-methyltransferase 1